MNGVNYNSPPGGFQPYPSSDSGSGSAKNVADTLAIMLSINFSTPLAGAARSERIKQMTNGHPAFLGARKAQEILVKIQTCLRRMPGVSSPESNEIVAELQEVGQIITTEISQLVDALMNVTLDHDDTEKAVARMSIEANLAKARTDDQDQTIKNLTGDLLKEKQKRRHAEEEVVKVMDDFQKLTEDFKFLKEKEESNEGTPSRETIKKFQETIQHLEEQVNNRRSLWIMKHSDAQSVTRAIETIADSCPNKEAVRKSIMSLQTSDKGEEEAKKPQDMQKLSRVFSDMAVPPRAPTGFQPNRPPTVGPPKFGPLQTGPPRASSTAPYEWRYQGALERASPGFSRFGTPGNGPFPVPAFNRAPSRRGFHNGGGSYRPNAPEFQPANFAPPGDISRPPTSFGHRREFFPSTPSSIRNKYGRHQDMSSPEYGNPYSNALVSRSQSTGPLIHVTEMAVKAWNNQIITLYSVIRRFVEQSASDPTFISPIDLNQTRLWPILLAIYHPLSEAEAISYLDFHLKEQSSKSCLVTRVIIDYIVNRVWVPRAWTGSTQESTYGLLEIERELERTQGQPSSTRQPLLDRQAAFVDAVMKREQHSQFSRGKIEEIVETVIATIQPFFNETVNEEEVYEDLEAVAEAAWNLSSRILTSRLTFDFRFPEVGSRFSCQSMVPIWPDMDPMEIQAKHWRVALVTTPVITCRNDTGANISAHSVSLADVICMQ